MLWFGVVKKTIGLRFNSPHHIRRWIFTDCDTMDWVNTLPIILVLGIFVVIFGNLLYDSLKTLVAQKEPKCPAPCCEDE